MSDQRSAEQQGCPHGIDRDLASCRVCDSVAAYNRASERLRRANDELDCAETAYGRAVRELQAIGVNPDAI